jgi:hypothetical protein
MKQAKKRLLPTLARLYSSTRRADRALAKTFAAISASEKRMRRREQEHAGTRESLERMLASFDVARHGGEVMAFPAVGREAS